MKTAISKLERTAAATRSVAEYGGAQPLLGPGWKSARRLAHFRTWRIFAAIVGYFAVSVVSHAQSFSIDWFTIDGGGGTSTGGVLSVSGTIGQSDANPQPMTGGNFSLVGGFWSLLAMQTPGAPLLTIQLTGTNTALVSWPSPSTGFTLQKNFDLNTTNWSAVPQPPADNGTRRFIIVDPPVGNLFYRLCKP